MAVYINIDPHAVRVKVDAAWKKSLAMITHEILEDMQQYCKFADGALVQSAERESRLEEGLIKWRTPYARRQYYEIKTAYKDHHPLATWKWGHVAKAHHQREWTAKAQRILRMQT